MKLLRTELVRGIRNQLFEIPVQTLHLEEFRFFQEMIHCRLSAEVIPDGFKLFGELSVPFIETCDRCLEDYQRIRTAPFELWLTPQAELVAGTDTDMILFPETLQAIDLSPVFHDLVALEEPMKKLCREDCRGLCPGCGVNLNRTACTCTAVPTESPWQVLEKLIK
jgi:uncharacterized protein